MENELVESTQIRTNRLLITPFRERHLSMRYVQWLNDPELMKYSEQRHKVHTLDTCREYYQSYKGTSNLFWAIEEVQTQNKHIGNINAYIDIHNRLADVGILIGAKEAHGKGYGLEAWIGVGNFLFDSIGIRKLAAGTMSVNVPMIKLMLRAGMIDDGVRKNHYLHNGREVDIVYMALFRKP